MMRLENMSLSTSFIVIEQMLIYLIVIIIYLIGNKPVGPFIPIKDDNHFGLSYFDKVVRVIKNQTSFLN